jgi:hypothetical protein
VSKPSWTVTQLAVRAVRNEDLTALAGFSCSSGTEWEEEVEEQIRGPLPHRYLGWVGSDADPRMLVVLAQDGDILAVAAHHVEAKVVGVPGGVQDIRPTYLEVLAVSLRARRTVVDIGQDPALTFGEFTYDVTMTDIRNRTGRDPLIFGRVNWEHVISLAFCDRVGLSTELVNEDPTYVQRWGDVAPLP